MELGGVDGFFWGGCGGREEGPDGPGRFGEEGLDSREGGFGHFGGMVGVVGVVDGSGDAPFCVLASWELLGSLGMELARREALMALRQC